MSRGKILGERYKIGEKIGAGAFGNVYYCVDLSSTSHRRSQNNRRHGVSNDCLLSGHNSHYNSASANNYNTTASPDYSVGDTGSSEKDPMFHSVSEIEPVILEALLTTGAVPSDVLYKVYEEKRQKAFHDHLRRQHVLERKNQKLLAREALLREHGVLSDEEEQHNGATVSTEANSHIGLPNRANTSGGGGIHRKNPKPNEMVCNDFECVVPQAYAPRGLEDMCEVSFDDATAECVEKKPTIGKSKVNYDDMRFDDDQEDVMSNDNYLTETHRKSNLLTSTQTFDSGMMSSITSPQDIPMRPLLVPKVYAVKVLSKIALRATEGMEAAFEREVESMKIVSEKQCRHIINIVDVLQSSRNYYLVMDLADKGNLLTVVVKGGGAGLTVPTARKYFKQLLTGLKAIHDADVAHRDIKPDNLLLDSWHEIKISDFGFAAYSPDGRRLTRCCGTPQYTAPELHEEDPSYDGRKVDMWSVGVTLYLMVFGRLPFVDANRERLYDKIRSGYYQIPPTVRKPPTPALLHLLSVLLDTNANTRWSVDMVRRHPWVHGFDTLPSSLQKSHITNIKHRYLKMKAAASAAVAAVQHETKPIDHHRRMSGQHIVEDSVFGPLKKAANTNDRKHAPAKVVTHGSDAIGRPPSGDKRASRPSHLEGVYLGASYDEMLNRGGVLFTVSSPIPGSSEVRSPVSNNMNNSTGSDRPHFNKAKKVLVPTTNSKGGRGHNPLQGATASGDIGASSYPETASSNGIGPENDSFVLNADLVALAQFEAENTIDGIFEDDEAAFAGGAGLQYLLRHAGHHSEGIALESHRRSESCPARMIPDKEPDRSKKSRSRDLMSTDTPRQGSIVTFSDPPSNNPSKSDNNAMSPNNQLVQLLIQYLEDGVIVPDGSGRLRLGITLSPEELKDLKKTYFDREVKAKQQQMEVEDGADQYVAQPAQTAGVDAVEMPLPIVSCSTPSGLIGSNHANSSGGVSPSHLRAAITPAISSPTSRPITGSPAHNFGPAKSILGSNLQRHNTNTPSMNSDRETPQNFNETTGSSKFGRNTPNHTKASGQQKEIEDRVQRGILKRIGIIHVRIAIHFIAVFSILFVAGALRVLFDIDISLWPWPQFVRTLIQRILTPPTRKQSNATPQLKASKDHHHHHTHRDGVSPHTTSSTPASASRNIAQGLNSIVGNSTSPVASASRNSNSLRQRQLSSYSNSHNNATATVASRATAGASASVVSALLPIPQSTTTNTAGSAETPGSFSKQQTDVRAAKNSTSTPLGYHDSGSTNKPPLGHSPLGEHGSASTHNYLLGLVTTMLPQKLARPLGISPSSTDHHGHHNNSNSASAVNLGASTAGLNSHAVQHTPSSLEDSSPHPSGLKRRMLASRQRAASNNSMDRAAHKHGRSHVEEFVEQQALLRQTGTPPLPPTQPSPVATTLLQHAPATESTTADCSELGSPMGADHTTNNATTGPHSPATTTIGNSSTMFPKTEPSFDDTPFGKLRQMTPSVTGVSGPTEHRASVTLPQVIVGDTATIETESVSTNNGTAKPASEAKPQAIVTASRTMPHAGSMTLGSSDNSGTGKQSSLLHRPSAMTSPTNTNNTKVSFVTDKLTTMAAMRAHERELNIKGQPTSPPADASTSTPPLLGATPASPTTQVSVPEALKDPRHRSPLSPAEALEPAEVLVTKPNDDKARERLKGLRRVESVFVGNEGGLDDFDVEAEEEEGLGSAKASNSELAT